jgi:hypothetical protein
MRKMRHKKYKKIQCKKVGNGNLRKNKRKMSVNYYATTRILKSNKKEKPIKKQSVKLNSR